MQQCWVRRLSATTLLLCGLPALASARQLPPFGQLPHLSTASPSTTGWVRDLLVQYANGDSDVFSALTWSDLRDVQSVPEPGFGGERARHVRAAFGLELARSVGGARWHDVVRVCEWVRTVLIMRPLKRDEFDRHWHEVLIATLEGAGDFATLDTELKYALEEFPNEPRFVLARAVSEELRLQSDLIRGRLLSDISQSQFARLRADLQAAIALPAVHGEAALRLGRLELMLDRHAQAVERFTEAEPLLDEPALRYLVRLFRGEALAGLGRADEAERAYRAALEVGPDVQSATLKLAGLLFVEGRRDESDAMVDHLIALPAPNWDPWWIYRNGDLRFVTESLDALRRDSK